MLRYACSNPWCYQGSHYTPICPYRRSPDPPQRYHSLSPERARALAERQFREMRRAAQAAERERRNLVPNPNDPPPVVQEPPGYGWRLVVGVAVALALLALLVFAFFQ